MRQKTQNKRIPVLTALVLILAVLLVLTGINLWKIKKYTESEGTKQTTVGASGVEIYLPDVYYAASGLTMEIYNSQITNLGQHISEYDVVWDCEVGEALSRKFSIAATDDLIGEYPLNVSVYDTDGTLLAKKASTLSIVEAKKKDFSILAIGDSLSANGALYAKLEEHFDNRMICNGTRGYEGFLTEARLGFSASDYLTETGYALEEGEDVHKFWNPEKKRFDWNYYKETTGFHPDMIQLFLGTNGLMSGDENAENICEIVKLIRKDDKKIPIYVVNTIYQSDQNGIGSMKMKNGALMFPGEYKQARDLYNFRLMAYLSDHLKGERNIYLVPAAISVDSANVFTIEERPVNPYAEATESYAVDAVHPSAAGYYQIADTIYSTMCGTMENWK